MISSRSFSRRIRDITAIWRQVLAALAVLLIAVQPQARSEAITNADLSSTQRTVTASNTHITRIVVGGKAMTVSPGQAITPAEFAAVNQVLNGGRQALILGILGNAIAGRLNLAADATALSSLVVPHAVTVITRFAAQPTIILNGDLINAGRIFALRDEPAVTAAQLSAASIYNMKTGLISSVVPPSLQSSSAKQRPLDLSLLSAGLISNAGTISSSGNLSLITANLSNSGILTALSGDVVLDSPPANIQIKNNGGIISARAGDIDIRSSSFDGKFNVSLAGGDLLSNRLNIFSGCGAVNVNARNITGLVSVTAHTASITGSTPHLKLGSINLTGDPTFFNLAGDVDITSNLAFSAAPLAIVASGNIISLAGASAIDTSSGTTNGGSVMLVAGAKIIPTMAPAATTDGSGGSDADTPIRIVGPSGTGGKIDLGGLSPGGVAISTFSTAATSTSTVTNGGNVTLVAFGGTAAGSGTINLPTNVTIATGSSDQGNAGNVTIIGGAHADPSNLQPAIVTGGINTSGGGFHSFGGGEITVRTSTPQVNNAPFLITNGALSHGSFTAGDTQHASITTGAYTTNTSAVTVIAGRDIALNGSITTAGSDAGVIAGRNITVSAAASHIDTSSTIGGGRVVLAAGVEAKAGNSFDDANLVGTTVTGGSINAPNAFLINSRGLFSSGFNPSVGGNVAVVASPGSAAGSGVINMPSTNIESGGDQTSINPLFTGSTSGSITIIGGATAGTAVHIGNLDSSVTAGGSDGSGNIFAEAALLSAGLPSQPLQYQPGGTFPTFKTIFGGKDDLQLGNIQCAGGSVLIATPGNIIVGSITDNGFGEQAYFLSPLTINAVSISAGGTANLGPFIHADADPVTGLSGGQVDISAAKISADASQGTLITANGTGGPAHTDPLFSTQGNGAGGFLRIGSTNSLNIGGSPGSAANKLQLQTIADPSASSGQIAAIQVFAAGGIVADVTAPVPAIDMSTSGSAASGGQLVLSSSTSTGTIQIVGTLHSDAGGDIQISMTSATPFVIGGTGANSAGGLSTAPGASGIGGFIDVTNNGSGGIALADATKITGSGEFQNIDLNAPNGPISTSTGTGTLSASGGNTQIQLTARAFNIVGAPFSISADDNAGATFRAGTINITSTGTGKQAPNNGLIKVGTGVGEFNLSASGVAANQSGGHLTVHSAAGILVDAVSALNVAAAATKTGGNIELTAGANGGVGTLVINGTLSVNGDTSGGTAGGGTVQLTSNSPLPFTVGTGNTTNGITGNITANGGSGGSITILNHGGPVTVAAGATSTKSFGSGTVFGGSQSLTAMKGNLTVESGLNVSGNTFGGQIILNAPKGNVLVNGDLLANAGTTFGGFITITSGGSSAFVADDMATSNGVSGKISATGDRGGSISITNNGKGGIKIPNADDFLVTGTTDGGSITLTAAGGGAIFVNGDGLSVSASTNPGQISLLAPKGPVFIDGAVTANTSSGAGGKITIVASSPIPFNVGAATSQAPNGLGSTAPIVSATGGTNGGTVSITNSGSGGIVSSAAVTLISVTAGNGAGGTIVLDAQSGKLSIAGGLDASGAFGNGGQISLISNSTTTFNVGSPTGSNGIGGAVTSSGINGGVILVANLGSGGLTISAPSEISVAPTSARAGTLKLLAPKGKFTWLGGAMPLSADGGDGAIRLLAQSYVINGNMKLSADGAVGFDGGDISVYSLAPNKALNVNNAGTSDISISCQGASAAGSGGIVTLSSGGSIIVNPNALSASPKASNQNGAKILLIAGTAGQGTVDVTNSLSANASGTSGVGGVLSIITNSSTPFNLGQPSGKVLNGIAGTLTASGGSAGGSIGIRNNGTGGITIPSLFGQLDVSTGINGSAGDIDLESPKGALVIQSGSSTPVISVSGGEFGGILTINAKTINIVGGALSVQANATGLGSFGGTININQTSSSLPLILGSVAGGIVFSAVGSTLGGDINLTSGNNIVIAPGGTGNQNTNVSLTVAGKSTITSQDTSSVLTGLQLTLNIGTGNVGAFQSGSQLGNGNANLQTSVTSVVINSQGGSVFINNSFPFAGDFAISGTVKPLSVKGGQFVVAATSAGLIAGGIVAEKATISLLSASNRILVGDLSGSAFNLIEQGTGGIGELGGIISGSNAVLNIVDGAGGIGFANSSPPLNTSVKSMNITAGTGVNSKIFITNSGSLKVNLQDAVAGQDASDISIAASGSIFTASSITAANSITLQTTNGSHGSVILTGNVTSGSGPVVVSLDGSGSLIQEQGSVISAGAPLSLHSDSGNLGTNSNPLLVNTPATLNATTSGAGIINISSQSPLHVAALVSGGNLTLTSQGTITTPDNAPLSFQTAITSQSGSVFIHQTASVVNPIAIGANNAIFAGGGSLTIENDDTTNNGQISFGTGTILFANGNINVIDGPLPANPTVGTAPASNWQVSGNTSNVFYGAGITVGPPGNLANVSGGGKIVFNGLTGTSVTFAGGNTITSNAALPAVGSLDLTSKQAVANLLALPGVTTSNLTKSASGGITGGTITISSSVNLASLTALNIPSKVTLQLVGFDGTAPIGLDITAGSTTKSALVNGTIAFVGDGSTAAPNATAQSNPILFAGSTVPGDLLTLKAGAKITSDASFTADIGGNTTLAGTVTAPAVLSLNTTLGVNSPSTDVLNSSNIKLSGTLNSTLDSFFSVTSNGTITVVTSAGFSQTAGAINGNYLNIFVSGSNALVQQGGNIDANFLQFTGGTLATTIGTSKTNSFLSSNISGTTLPGNNLLSLNDYRGFNIATGSLTAGGGLTITAPGIFAEQSIKSTDSMSFVTTSYFAQNATVSSTSSQSTISFTSLSKTGLFISGDSSTIHAANGLSVTSKGVIQSNGGPDLITDAGPMTITATGTVQFGSNITRGSNGASPGSVLITAGGNLNYGESVAPVTLLNTNGDVILSSGGETVLNGTPVLTVHGGNLIIASKLDIISGIHAVSLNVNAGGTNVTNQTGGMLVLSAGNAKPVIQQSVLLSTLPQTLPLPETQPSFGSASFAGTGAFLFSGAPNTLTVRSGPTIQLDGGALIVNTKNNQDILLEQTTLTVHAFSPAGWFDPTTDGSNDFEELVVDSDECEAHQY